MMDNSKRYDDLFEDIEATKKRTGETADKFPKSKEEYLVLDLEERLGVAKAMLKTYAYLSRYEGRGNYARASIEPADRPGLKLSISVAYLCEKKKIRDYEENVPEGIGIWARAYDPATRISSNATKLGELREGKFTDSEGEKQKGWHLHINEDTTVTLESSRGQEALEFVDAAATGLIEGIIDKNRKLLGNTALEGAGNSYDGT
jgi:hypothetical protein